MVQVGLAACCCTSPLRRTAETQGGWAWCSVIRDAPVCLFSQAGLSADDVLLLSSLGSVCRLCHCLGGLQH